MYYIIRRIFYAIPIMIGVTIVCFLLIHIGPVDPILTVTPDSATSDQIEAIKKAYGFDKPIPIQYFLWLRRAITGDLGLSVQSRRPVTEELFPALYNTMVLAAVATVFSFTLSFVLGVVAAYWNGRWIDRVLTGVGVFGVSVPNYWLGIVLAIIFAVELNLLPGMGMGSGGSTEWAWDSAHIPYLILPALTVSAVPVGIITRTTRACVLEVLSQEHVLTLYSKGISSWKILIHIFKNAAPTILAVTGVQFAQLLGGSILVETVFAWPGSGYLLNESIFKLDLPVLQATLGVLALFFVCTNLIVDILQTFLDPRIKRG